jgi:hypothetical protein
MGIQPNNRFTRLLTKEPLGYQNNHRVWKCLCDCGRECVARQDKLLSGRTKSCGCLNAENNLRSEEVKQEQTQVHSTVLELKKTLILANRLKNSILTRRMVDAGIPPTDSGFDFKNFEATGSPRQTAQLLLRWANIVNEVLSFGPEDELVKIQVSIKTE